MQQIFIIHSEEDLDDLNNLFSDGWVSIRERIDTFDGQVEGYLLLEKSKTKARTTTETTLPQVEQAYNSFLKKCTGLYYKQPSLTPQRKTSINARIKEHGIEKVEEMLDEAGASEFLSESNFASIDWIFRPTNFVKVLEGKYRGDSQQPFKLY